MYLVHGLGGEGAAHRGEVVVGVVVQLVDGQRDGQVLGAGGVPGADLDPARALGQIGHGRIDDAGVQSAGEIHRDILIVGVGQNPPAVVYQLPRRLVQQSLIVLLVVGRGVGENLPQTAALHRPCAVPQHQPLFRGQLEHPRHVHVPGKVLGQGLHIPRQGDAGFLGVQREGEPQLPEGQQHQVVAVGRHKAALVLIIVPVLEAEEVRGEPQLLPAPHRTGVLAGLVRQRRPGQLPGKLLHTHPQLAVYHHRAGEQQAGPVGQGRGASVGVDACLARLSLQQGHLGKHLQFPLPPVGPGDQADVAEGGLGGVEGQRSGNIHLVGLVQKAVEGLPLRLGVAGYGRRLPGDQKISPLEIDLHHVDAALLHRPLQLHGLPPGGALHQRPVAEEVEAAAVRGLAPGVVHHGGEPAVGHLRPDLGLVQLTLHHQRGDLLQGGQQLGAAEVIEPLRSHPFPPQSGRQRHRQLPQPPAQSRPGAVVELLQDPVEAPQRLGLGPQTPLH